MPRQTTMRRWPRVLLVTLLVGLAISGPLIGSACEARRSSSGSSSSALQYCLDRALGNPTAERRPSQIALDERLADQPTTSPLVPYEAGDSPQWSDDPTGRPWCCPDHPSPEPATERPPSEQTAAARRQADAPKTILWSADYESGDTSQWSQGQWGEAVFNNGTGLVDVVDEVARSGRYSLRLSADPPDGQAHGARIFRWADQRQEAYYSTWLYFPERYHSMDWFTVLQFKSRGQQSKVAWTLNVGNRMDGSMTFYWWDATTLHNHDEPATVHVIPIREWIHIEIFYRASAGPDGHVIMWLNGARIYDIGGVQTLHALGDEVHFGLASYTDRISPRPAVVYADDTIISARRLGAPGHDVSDGPDLP